MERNTAVIGLGSNIDPERNIGLARGEISRAHRVLKSSEFVETEPFGYKDQNAFINGALLVETPLGRPELKSWLTELESKLGRVRGTNKFGPRPIDLDILVWNGEIADAEVYRRDFLQNSIKELLPDIKFGGAE